MEASKNRDGFADKVKTTLVRFINFLPTKSQALIAKTLENVIAVLGGFSSGKTSAGAFLTLQAICRHSYHPYYGKSKPLILVISPTRDILKTTTLPALFKMIPDEMIVRENKQSLEYEFSNGCVLKGMTFGGRSIEGMSPVWIWVDECHKIDRYTLTNIFARYHREPTSKLLGRRKGVVFTGIPYIGTPIEEQFREPIQGRKTFLLSLKDNPHVWNDEEQRSQVIQATPENEKDTLIYGKWGKRLLRVFSNYSAIKNLKALSFDKSKPIYVGCDVGGNYGGLVIAQPFDLVLKSGQAVKGLNIIDEVIFDDAPSCEKMSLWLAKSKYADNVDTICFDPTIRNDERNWFKTRFPSVKLIKKKHKSREEAEEFGIHCANRGFSDGDENIRIFVETNLKKNKNGLINCLENYERNPKTQRPMYFDAQGDHQSDAFRYLCAHFLDPKDEARNIQNSGPRITSRR